MVLVTPDELILPELVPKLGAYAQRKLLKRGIEIITGERVKAATSDGIELTNVSARPVAPAFVSASQLFGVELSLLFGVLCGAPWTGRQTSDMGFAGSRV